MSPDDWPPLNAFLNGAAGVLLLAGYTAIKLRYIRLHTGCMLTALLVSVLFLTSYLYYHLAIQRGNPTHYGGTGALKVTYYTILLTHVILAAAVAPLALFTAYQGLRGNLKRHVRIARWTLPIWLYVSVTGVVVYLMLRPYYNSGAGG
jgi:putative membrane protein